MNEIPEKKRSRLPQILLILVGIIVVFLLLRLAGVNLTWTSEDTAVQRKPGLRDAESTRKQEVIQAEDDQLLEALADYFSGESTLDEATKEKLREYLYLTRDEIEFYRMVGEKRNAVNTASWKNTIREVRPIYWKIKEIIGDLVYKPGHRVNQEDLLLVLRDGQKTNRLFRSLESELGAKTSDLEWFFNQVENETISSWAFFVWAQ